MTDKTTAAQPSKTSAGSPAAALLAIAALIAAAAGLYCVMGAKGTEFNSGWDVEMLMLGGGSLLASVLLYGFSAAVKLLSDIRNALSRSS